MENGSPLELIEGYDTSFKGYDNMILETEVLGILVDGNTTNRIDKGGEEGIIILKETPFYAESGGQVGEYWIYRKRRFQRKVSWY